jgi:LysM repeat protein
VNLEWNPPENFPKLGFADNHGFLPSSPQALILPDDSMKPVIWLPSLSALTLLIASCANQKSADPNDPGYGPFDQFGNYREDWADDPSKWRRPGSRQTPQEDPPQIAKNEQPPANANPLPPAGTPAPKVQSSPKPTTTAQTKPKPKPTVVKAKPKPKPQPQVTRYTVKKGDTLSGIASKYRSSVSAIQRANRISGTLIRPGQSLVVPKTR